MFQNIKAADPKTQTKSWKALNRCVELGMIICGLVATSGPFPFIYVVIGPCVHNINILFIAALMSSHVNIQ